MLDKLRRVRVRYQQSWLIAIWTALMYRAREPLAHDWRRLPPISFDGVEGPRQKFSGVEWLHLELGADYYAFSGLGLGPYGALGLSSYTKRPDAAGSAAVNVDLSVGLRVLLDLPGR